MASSDLGLPHASDWRNGTFRNKERANSRKFQTQWKRAAKRHNSIFREPDAAV
jgi:hypothetical protein